MKDESFEVRLLVIHFICRDQTTELIDWLKREHQPDFPDHSKEKTREKLKAIQKLYPQFKKEDIFPAFDQISSEIDLEYFIQQHFSRPPAFLKALKNSGKELEEDLNKSQISYKKENEHLFKVESGANFSELKSVKDGVTIVSDLTVDLLAREFQPREGESWWDACAGSGGKALHLLAKNPAIKLWATDNRETILENLRKRTRDAGLPPSSIEKAELTHPNEPPEQKFDHIIADLPCSGSGTWNRNPEHLIYFGKESVHEYRQQQQKILENVWKGLKEGGELWVVTCSVYETENEQNVKEFLQKHEGTLLKDGYIKGYEHDSITLYRALIRKNA